MQALPALEQLEVSEAVQSSPLFDREIRIAMGTGRQGLCGLATGHGAGLGGYTLSVFGVGVLSRSGGAGLEFGGFGLGFWRHPGAGNRRGCRWAEQWEHGKMLRRSMASLRFGSGSPGRLVAGLAGRGRTVRGSPWATVVWGVGTERDIDVGFGLSRLALLFSRFFGG